MSALDALKLPDGWATGAIESAREALHDEVVSPGVRRAGHEALEELGKVTPQIERLGAGFVRRALHYTIVNGVDEEALASAWADYREHLSTLTDGELLGAIAEAGKRYEDRQAEIDAEEAQRKKDWEDLGKALLRATWTGIRAGVPYLLMAMGLVL